MRTQWAREKFHADPSDPSSPYIYGNAVRMLRHGGPWRPTEELPTHFDHYRPQSPEKPHSVRSRPREVEFYPGEFATEPDPSVSNVRWTGQLIKFMRSQGWTMEQARLALADPRNVGGEFYRFMAMVDSGFLARYWEGSVPERSGDAVTANTESQGTVLAVRNQAPQAEAWAMSGTFRLTEEQGLKVALFIRSRGECIGNDMRTAKFINGRVLGSVLPVLVERGLVQVERKSWTANGRTAQRDVFTLTPEGLAFASVDEAPQLSPENLRKLIES